MSIFYGQDDSVQSFVVGSWEAVKHARTAASFLDQEAGLPILQAQFNSYRTFNWVAGILSLLQSSAEQSTCCTEWAREFGLPDPDILIDLTKDMQSAYIQGIISDPKGATTDEMQYWYADIITNRERDDADVIIAIQEGQIPITQTEQKAADQANEWREMVIAGGAERTLALQEARIDPDTGAVASDWADTVAPADSATTHRSVARAPLALTAPGRLKASDLAVGRYKVAFSGFGSPEVPATDVKNTIAIRGKDIAKVAGGGVAIYLLLEAMAHLQRRN